MCFTHWNPSGPLYSSMQIPCVLAALGNKLPYHVLQLPPHLASQYIFPMKRFESYELWPYFSLKETNH